MKTLKKKIRRRKASEEPYISVIIPLFNEKENIAPLYNALKTHLDPSVFPYSYEVILTDDGSTDGTYEECINTVSGDPDFRLIKFRKNSGQTAAIMAGMDHSRGKILVPMDGDLQNDPADIIHLIKKIEEGYDVVSGWRKERKDDSLRRNLPSKAANSLISLISGVRLHDFGCTLKAYRRSVVEGIRLYGEMHRFIPIYAEMQGAKITEIPVRHNARRAGVSKYGLGRTWKVILDLITVKFLSEFSQKPVYLFGGFALLNVVLGFFVFLWMVWLKYAEGINFNRTPLPNLIIIFYVTAFQSLFFGLIAEILMRTYYESQNKRTYIISESLNILSADGEESRL